MRMTVQDWPIRLAGLIMLVALLALVGGCSSPPKEIPFEPIALCEASYYEEYDPKIMIVSEEGELEELPGISSPYGFDLEKALSEIDFSVDFLIVAFQGHQLTGGYEIEILDLQQRGKRVEIGARFISPASRATLNTPSPCHLIRVSRADLTIAGRLTFVLVDDLSGKEVAKEVDNGQ